MKRKIRRLWFSVPREPSLSDFRRWKNACDCGAIIAAFQAPYTSEMYDDNCLIPPYRSENNNVLIARRDQAAFLRAIRKCGITKKEIDKGTVEA
jgi:hypothetical protein